MPKSTSKLKQYFPMIREREDIKQEIYENPKLLEKYREWDEEQQEEFLDYCTGVKGVKILYDAFFKEIMNPENTPERLNELLSLLLGQSVTIKRVLPGDSTRLADEQSLLIMDILVELADTSLANVEVQKIGYSAQAVRPDAIIACMHWGEEYQSLPNREQCELADWLLKQLGQADITGISPPPLRAG